jgi:hypothetical protein
MKNLKSILPLIILLFMICSVKATAQSNYGSWETSSCYKGIDFCVKKSDYNQYTKTYTWYVKFRNNYLSKVNFSFIAKESTASAARTNSMTTIGSGKETSATSFPIADSNSIRVFIDQMTIGEYTGKFAPCDK